MEQSAKTSLVEPFPDASWVGRSIERVEDGALLTERPTHEASGRSIERVEDGALLTGRGRFIDDLGVDIGTLHAAILRSPHAHADVKGADTRSEEHTSEL